MSDKSVKREVSSQYPAATIEECFEFIKIVDSLGGKSVAYESVLDAMGITSPTTKSFLYRNGASKQYALVNVKNKTIQLTEIANKILYPPDGRESIAHLREVFSNPPLYQKLIERFDGKALPPTPQLSNILMNEYQIIKTAKNHAAECFVKSAEYLGFFNNGILSTLDEASNDTSTISERELGQEQLLILNESSNLEKAATYCTTNFVFTIPTVSGKTAIVEIPKESTEKDLDYIKHYIEGMLPMFIQNLKDELKQR